MESRNEIPTTTRPFIFTSPCIRVFPYFYKYFARKVQRNWALFMYSVLTTPLGVIKRYFRALVFVTVNVALPAFDYLIYRRLIVV